jgi:hypothetical protein
MMREHYADMARRWVRRNRTEAPPQLPRDRRRLVSAVEQALHTRARRRVVVRWASGGGAIAVAAGLVLALKLGAGLGLADVTAFLHRSGGADAGRIFRILKGSDSDGSLAMGGAAARPVTPGMSVEAGAQVMAPSTGLVQVGALDGTALTLEPGGSLTVTEAGKTQRFALRHGAVRARVTKLHRGERFLINTADAEIEVHGTAFRVATGSVDPSCPAGSHTRVSVTEGVVTVRWEGREERLLPGDEWPTGCPAATAAQAAAKPEPQADLELEPPPAAAAAPVAPVKVARALPARPAARPPPARSPAEAPAPPDEKPPAPVLPIEVAMPAAPPPPPPSELAEQNDLFAAAVRAKRQGRPGDAIRLFTQLIQQYPQSPLLESALAQRMKMLAARDAWAGAEAAHEYLRRFPGGFARAEARALAAAAATP